MHAAGVPTVIKPFFGDQFFWADRVEALGVGSAVRKLTVQSLTDALVSATNDPKQIARAKAVGEQIRAVSPDLCSLFELVLTGRVCRRTASAQQSRLFTATSITHAR